MKYLEIKIIVEGPRDVPDELIVDLVREVQSIDFKGFIKNAISNKVNLKDLERFEVDVIDE